MILTALCGHAHLDLPAYGRYLAGQIVDYDLSDAALADSVAELPVPQGPSRKGFGGGRRPGEFVRETTTGVVVCRYNELVDSTYSPEPARLAVGEGL